MCIVVKGRFFGMLMGYVRVKGSSYVSKQYSHVSTVAEQLLSINQYQINDVPCICKLNCLFGITDDIQAKWNGIITQ